jgi:hypothetical protein
VDVNTLWHEIAPIGIAGLTMQVYNAPRLSSMEIEVVLSEINRREIDF